ncbi:protein FAM204A isoform X3 [Pristis pectinata]|uniref:protein FAM204A isoform X3 n=1 Tax=Pristis pectinata TaxID=685728 RepID=UPI00223E1280|nr:protein FAM204A isoform X3 [Pristis pectinata]
MLCPPLIQRYNPPEAVMVDSTDQKPICVLPEESGNTSKLDSCLKEKKSSDDMKDVTEECPSGVSLQLWKKFQELKERRKAIAQPSLKKRVRRKRKIAAAEGLINVGRNSEEPSIKMQKSEEEQKTETESELAMREAHWNELRQYFGANDRFKSPACSTSRSKTSLEKNLDKAIATGDIDEAERLSDNLAVRKLGVQIAKAVDCRDFAKAKQEAEASQQALKKKQLAWGFEAKKRWETKSNMGYM